jgi:hypothetical protein
MSSAKQSLAKQVIYVDVDDEITTIIDKMNASEAKVVALVLPKRASVFQSIVNMKLLKRRAETAKKHIVLITSEAGLMPLAGLAGVHVATTLQSKPEIPLASTEHGDDDEEDEELTANDDFDPAENAKAPVGALAGTAISGIGVAAPVDEDVIELDNTAKRAVVSPIDNKNSKAAAKKPAKDRKLKIPNFFSFRKRLILGGLVLVLLIVGWYVAYFVMPKATITIATNSSDVDARLSLTLDTAATVADATKLVLPAQTKQEQKSNTGQAPATGQENKGEKASGKVRLAATRCAPNIGQPDDIPAGTGITTDSGNIYLTQKASSFSYNGTSSGSCINYRSDDIDIVAQKGGASYNTSDSANFKVSGTVTATGSATGGTDNIVKIVQQSDVDAAKQKLTASQTQDQAALKTQLQTGLEDDGLYALTSTFFTGTPNDNLSSNVGDEAETVTVTESVSYTMFGIKKADLKKIIDDDLNKKINTKEQSILDDGLASARISVGTPGAGPQLKIDSYVTATAGPKIDTEAIKKAIVGMKTGNIKDSIKQYEGVDDVTVKFSPFWVTKAPKPEKITIQFEKSSATDSTDDN